MLATGALLAVSDFLLLEHAYALTAMTPMAAIPTMARVTFLFMMFSCWLR